MPGLLSIGDGIALAALLLSGYATWKTFKFNERQNDLIESQDRLNKLLVDKERGEALNSKRADLGATFIKLGSNKYRLKIWNKGKATARNVSLEFPEGNECLMQSDIDSKFPLEILDTHQSVELIAAVGMETKSKHPMRLIWNDESGERNEKLVYPTL